MEIIQTNTLNLTMAEARNLWGFKLLDNGNYEIVSCKNSNPILYFPSSINGIAVEKIKPEPRLILSALFKCKLVH